MRTSEQINELATALAKAQGKIVGALKDSANPFFKSKYADLASCWDACREQLTSNGLSVMQFTETVENGLAVTTRLAHASGQWVESTLIVHPKDDGPQAAGSAITYARRYGLAAIVGLAQVDDDGNAANANHTNGHHAAKIDPNPINERELSEVELKQAVTTAENMRAILERDVFDDEKCLLVADLNDTLKTQHELSLAAWKFLKSNERSYWKKLVAVAMEKEREEPRYNGR